MLPWDGSPRVWCWRSSCCCRGAVATGRPAQTPSGPGPAGPGIAPAHLLVVTHTTGFRHDSIPAAEAALRQIGLDSGLFDVAFCRTAAEVRERLTPAGLAGIDAVFFANTTGDLGIPDLPAFLDWIASGKAFLGAHSASDTYHGSPAFLAMLGGEFVTHGAIVDAEVRVAEPANPAVAHLPPTFRITDEWYRLTSLRCGADRAPEVRPQSAGRRRRRRRRRGPAAVLAEGAWLGPGVLHCARTSQRGLGGRTLQGSPPRGHPVGAESLIAHP